MEINRILVTDMIMAGSLFAEEGYDLAESADNLADLKGRIIIEYLEEQYPGIEIYTDIAIDQKAGASPRLEVLAYSEEGEVNRAVSAAICRELMERIATATADRSWAVKAA